MRARWHWIVIMIGMVLGALSAEVTEAGASVVITRGVVIDGDTLPHVRLDEVRSYARRKWKSKRAQVRYTRLVYNVRKVLPIARIANERLTIIQDSASKLDSKQRKKYLDEVEKQLFDEFEQPLRHLTMTQGRILIKLIDRETGDTSYELIKVLKGRFSAFLWQGVARLFGSNLKSNYDAEDSDREIENIINAIDDGLYDNYPMPQYKK